MLQTFNPLSLLMCHLPSSIASTQHSGTRKRKTNNTSSLHLELFNYPRDLSKIQGHQTVSPKSVFLRAIYQSRSLLRDVHTKTYNFRHIVHHSESMIYYVSCNIHTRRPSYLIVSSVYGLGCGTYYCYASENPAMC